MITRVERLLAYVATAVLSAVAIGCGVVAVASGGNDPRTMVVAVIGACAAFMAVIGRDLARNARKCTQ